MALLLRRQDVQSLLNMQDAISIIEDGFAAFARNDALVPQRVLVPIKDADGVSAIMPAYVRSTPALGVKIVSRFKHNPTNYNLPSICGVVLLLDANTGEPLSVMEASFLTAVRTGAASGVATKYLAREDSRVLGCIGAGAQALMQLWAVCEVRDIERIKIYSPHVNRRITGLRSKITRWSDARVEAVTTPEAAVRSSDIVILASSAATPVVAGSWFNAGTHINAIGSHAPAARELDTATLLRASVVCDSIDACLTEAGDLLIPIEEGAWRAENIYGHLGAIVTGELVGRADEEQITLFKSVGLAFQDTVTAQHTFALASARGVGIHIDLMS